LIVGSLSARPALQPVPLPSTQLPLTGKPFRCLLQAAAEIRK
jgi:hypothetical protein